MQYLFRINYMPDVVQNLRNNSFPVKAQPELLLGQVCLCGLTVCRGVYGGTKNGISGFLMGLLIYRKKIRDKTGETDQKALRKEYMTQLSGTM